MKIEIASILYFFTYIKLQKIKINLQGQRAYKWLPGTNGGGKREGIIKKHEERSKVKDMFTTLIWMVILHLQNHQNVPNSPLKYVQFFEHQPCCHKAVR